MQVLPSGVLLISALLPGVFAQPSQPGAAEQTAIIEPARAAALEYSNRLENVTCTRVMTRSADDSTTGSHYKQLETQEGELSYVNRKESYLPRKVNGQTTGLDKRVKKGYFIPCG